jgi:nucleoside-diphosphate-sugar epimerase
VYNIVDDRAIPLGDFITQLASAVGAPKPRTIPAWVIRLVAPLISELASIRLPLDNSKAKRELGWTLMYPTVDRGLAEVRSLLVAA